MILTKSKEKSQYSFRMKNRKSNLQSRKIPRKFTLNYNNSMRLKTQNQYNSFIQPKSQTYATQKYVKFYKALNNSNYKNTGYETYQKKNYTYNVEFGNNSQLIKKIMSGRKGWTQSKQNPNFIWKPTSYGLKFNDHFQNKKKIFNHIQNHKQLTNKANLYKNMLNYCQNHKSISIQQIFPRTFVFQCGSKDVIDTLYQFLDFYELIKNTNLKNTWIYKPSDLNRGRGISLLNDLQQLKQLISERSFLRYNINKLKYQQQTNIVEQLTQILTNTTYQHFRKKSFILQKYIQNPLLFNNRKFDIRVWVLIDHERNYYFFQQGYIRMSSEIYQLNSKSLKNKFIHLTNNAIQKDSQKYGKQEDGNQLSFSVLKKYLQQNYGKNFDEDIIKKMKEIIIISMNSVRKKINMKYKYNFQVFGYDFLIDRGCNLYLLEINTNPCIELSSQLLKSLVPRMLNDALKLTVDNIFPPSDQYDRLFKNCQYQLKNYSKYANLWELLGNLKNQQVLK